MATPSPPGRSNSKETSRRTSFGFLKRAKSNEPFRSISGGSMTKRSQAEAEAEALRQKRQAQIIPKLPDFTPPPQIKTFGGEDPQGAGMASAQESRMAPKQSMDNVSSNYSSHGPSPVPGSSPPVDPYARTESMTHRGRYSYASSAVSSFDGPRRVRRRKDPTPYNVLVIGARNCGKTSFINFLKTSLALPPKKKATQAPNYDSFEPPPTSTKTSYSFVHHYLETEIDAERVGLTLWDSQGLDKSIIDLQLRDMSAFVESKFDDTLNEERKLNRSPGVRDTHIHCVFFVFDPLHLDANIAAAQQKSANGMSHGKFSLPSRIVGGLDDDFEVQVLRTLQGKTTVIPVISKADTITTQHMAFLKRTVRDSLKKAGLDPLEALSFDGEEDSDDEFDEREEDRENARLAREREFEEPGTPRDDDSETIPQSPKSPLQRQVSLKHKANPSITSISMVDGLSLPFSILSPDSYSLNSSDGKVGRRFPWGFADPYDPNHCDFVKAKDTVFSELRADLREASKEVFYERWRTNRLDRAKMVRSNGQRLTSPAQNRPGGIPTGILRNG